MDLQLPHEPVISFVLHRHIFTDSCLVIRRPVSRCVVSFSISKYDMFYRQAIINVFSVPPFSLRKAIMDNIAFTGCGCPLISACIAAGQTPNNLAYDMNCSRAQQWIHMQQNQQQQQQQQQQHFQHQDLTEIPQQPMLSSDFSLMPSGQDELPLLQLSAEDLGISFADEPTIFTPQSAGQDASAVSDFFESLSSTTTNSAG